MQNTHGAGLMEPIMVLFRSTSLVQESWLQKKKKEKKRKKRSLRRTGAITFNGITFIAAW